MVLKVCKTFCGFWRGRFAGTLSVCAGISFVAPHINNLYFLSLCRRWGVYSVIRILFTVKLLLALLMLMVGPSSTLLLCIFIARSVQVLVSPTALPLSW